MAIRHQLAAYSPLSAAACARSAVAALGAGADPRDELRELLLKEYAADAVLLFGSGTQALQVAIGLASAAAYGKNRNDESLIAMPAFGCFDLASAAIGANARVSLYDVDPRTLSPDLVSLERVLAAGARVVVVTPLYGIPVDWDAIAAVASRYGAFLIEDSAQGQGATWRGRMLGTLGRISILSFGRGKGWTGGNGGAVLLRDGGAVDQPGLMNQGLSREVKTVVGLVAQWLLGRPATYGIPRSIPSLHLGETTYHSPAQPGAITRAAAASVLANRDRSLEEAEGRRAKARSMLALIAASSALDSVAISPEATPGFLRLPVRLVGGSGQEPSSEMRRAGIERSYPIVLNELPQLASRLNGPETEWPGAKRLVNELLTIPTHSRVTVGELQRFLK